MLFIFGTRLFGKVDEVPGMFHVATGFFHVDYVPLFPVKSYIVFPASSGLTGGIARRLPIPMNAKSIIVAWGRALAIVAMIVAVIFAGMKQDASTQISALVTILLAVGAIVFTYKYRPFTHANLQRACELGRLAGMNERGIRAIEQSFDRSIHGFPVEPIEPVQPAAQAQTAPINQPLPIPAAPVEAMFFVSGRNTQSNQDVCITVRAKDVAEARTKATTAGILVTAVEAGGGPPAEPSIGIEQ